MLFIFEKVLFTIITFTSHNLKQKKRKTADNDQLSDVSTVIIPMAVVGGRGTETIAD